ncbi:methyltransferase family protein [Streptomyces lavendulocolor]|uniref:methyltransferase family protein n=1 Tax=Streptomyces lavendulocolor TaxID=67316 RepID=UPI003F4D26C0
MGFVLIAAGWRHLHAAARLGRLATSGPYRHVRHPQYAGFLAIMAGFLLMWPTLPTLVMFPVLVWIYHRLAIREEAEVAARFGAIWEEYADSTPRFLPSPRRHTAAAHPAPVVKRASGQGSSDARRRPPRPVERSRADGR